MPGMGGSSFSSTNPLVVSLFRHSGFETSVSWIIAIALVMLVVASVLRRVNTFNLSAGGLGEARSRTYLRMAFGAIWLIDGFCSSRRRCRWAWPMASSHRPPRARRVGYTR